MSDKFNPNDYAHLEDDSAMIQAAVDAAAQSGAAGERGGNGYL